MIGKNKVLIIAEAGVNHNGSLDLAFKLVDAAAAAGADIVKFQTWKTENVVTRQSEKASYQLKTTSSLESQFEMLKSLELTYDNFRSLKKYCDDKNIVFLSTADEIESATFLNSLQNIFKVGSAELTDIPYLRKLAEFGKPIILSSGMGTLGEIERALDALISKGLSKDIITVLHCTTEYPTPYEDVNLLAMLTIRDAFKVQVGYSDHTLGIDVPIGAVALGAKVIEKHFTLDRKLPGPDHRLSLEPEELKSMVQAIRNIERALGNGIKNATLNEKKDIASIRKSLVAARKILHGERFSEENITAKRAGRGIDPSLWDMVIGRTAAKDYEQDEIILL